MKRNSLGLEDIGRLERTVQKMLTLSRLEQGPTRKKQKCNLANVVLEETIAQSRPYAEIKRFMSYAGV